MQLSTMLSNHRLFRFVWWIVCIPLEICRMLILLPILLIRRLTQKKFCILWTLALGSMLAYSPETFMNHTAYYALYSGFALGGICQMFPRLILSLFPYPTAFWRLAPSTATHLKPAKQKQIIASIAIAQHPSLASIPDRTAMTQRLAPELQKLIQKIE